MASLVLGTVGAVAGFAIGGPTGAMIGWSLGAALGNSLQGGQDSSISGQQLSDLRVMDSGYGNAIPKVYGSMRVAGSLIWAIDLVPVPHTTTTDTGGGKGGGSTVSQTSYTYNATFAIGLCKGPIAGIRRVWADGKLIYDARPGSTSLGSLPMTVYTGQPTQVADPTIQAYLGANTPAYRDLAYVVFANWDVSPYGNRIPSLTFEVVANATAAADSARVIIQRQPWPTVYFTPNGSAYAAFSISVGPTYPTGYTGLAAGQYIARIDLSTGLMIGYKFLAGVSSNTIVGTTPSGQLLVTGWYGANTLALVTPDTWTSQQITIPAPIATDVVHVGGAGYVVLNFGAGASNWIGQITYSGGVATLVTRFAVAGETQLWDLTTDGTYLYAVGKAGLYRFSGTTGTGTFSASFATDTEIVYQNGSVFAFTGAAGTLLTINASTLTLTRTLSSGITMTGGTSGIAVLEDGSLLLSSNASGDLDRHVDSTGATLLSGSYLSLQGSWDRTVENPATGEVYAYSFASGISAGQYVQIYSGRVSGVAPTLDTIVADICNQAGMVLSDYDVTRLASITVDGMSLDKQTNAVEWIRQLAAAYFFDGAEANKLVFIPRGGSSIVTIPAGDLAATTGSTLPAPLQIERGQESDQPRAINIGYLTTNGDYLQATQQARRQVTKSKNDEQIGLSLALDDAHAAQIASTILYSRVLGRTVYTWTTSLAYSKYEPSDVVTINGYTMRIVRDDRGADNTIRWTAVAEDASIYGSSAAGGAPNFPVQTVQTTQPTAALLLDIPQLRDVDTDAGFYLAAYSSNVTAWPGTQLFRSVDGGQTFQSLAAITPPAAVVGYAVTALASGVTAIPDEARTVQIALFDGSLSSVSFAQQTQLFNLALLGSEILCFRNAVQQADGSYILSGLLRGLYGTEWAIGTHVAGESFVLLTTATIDNIVGVAADLNVSRQYKAPTIGANIATAPPITFTNTGVRLKPWAPCNPTVGRLTTSDVVLGWTRRARYNNGLRDYSDVPLTEATESYDVEIWTSGFVTLKRTFAAVATPTVTYTSAQQVTDFGANQSTVFVRVYQNSATVGRGYVLQFQG